MKWIVRPGVGAMRHASLVYRKSEFSIDMSEDSTTVFATVLARDLQIGIDEHGKVVGVWGYCPHTAWQEAPTGAPAAEPAEVFLSDLTALQRHVSVELEGRWQMTPRFDPGSGWLRVGLTAVPEATFAQVSESVVLEVDASDNLAALWLRPRIID